VSGAKGFKPSERAVELEVLELVAKRDVGNAKATARTRAIKRYAQSILLVEETL
jgi:hypothetical protein